MNIINVILFVLIILLCGCRYVGPGSGRDVKGPSQDVTEYSIDEKGRRCVKINNGELVPIEEDKDKDYNDPKERTIIKLNKTTIYDSKYVKDASAD